MGFASATDNSAAWFIAVLSSSASPDMPTSRRARSAFSSAGGNGIVYFAFRRNPSGEPSWLIAVSIPREIAARRPALASLAVTESMAPAPATGDSAEAINHPQNRHPRTKDE